MVLIGGGGEVDRSKKVLYGVFWGRGRVGGEEDD